MIRREHCVEVSFDGPLPLCVLCGRLPQWRAPYEAPRKGMWWCVHCREPVMGPLPVDYQTKNVGTKSKATLAGPLPEGWA